MTTTTSLFLTPDSRAWLVVMRNDDGVMTHMTRKNIPKVCLCTEARENIHHHHPNDEPNHELYKGEQQLHLFSA